jgi:hypothetical protein
MDAAERFLIILYWKTKNNPAEGGGPGIIRRLLHIPAGDLKAILYRLTEDNTVKPDPMDRDRIVISSKGIELARSLIKKHKVSIIVFHSAMFIPPTDKLVFGFNYYYDLISPDGSQGNRSIGVFVSDVVAMTQQLSFDKDQSGERLLLQHGRDWVTEKVREGSLVQHEERIILTKDLDSLPKYSADELVPVFGAVYLAVPPETPIIEEIATNQLAPLLIETRDAINALFYDQNGERLLLLLQERNLLDFFKDATNADEFCVRVISLGATSREMNKEVLRRLTGITDIKEGSVNLLKAYLLTRNSVIDPVIKPLQHFGRIRNGYPAHTDYANVVDSYRYFGISYPIENFSRSWQLLLNHYLIVLQELKRILLQK